MALNTIIDFFSNQIPYKLNDLIQQMFIEDLVLLIAKGYMPLVMVETFGYGVFWCGNVIDFQFTNNLFESISQLYWLRWRSSMCSQSLHNVQL